MTKPEPKLSHMPLNIKERIFEKIDDWKTKESLSFVSKDFFACAKKSAMKLSRVSLQLLNNKVIVEVRYITCDFFLKMEFYPQKNGYLMKNREGGWKKVVEGEDYRKAAAQFLMSFFNNQKTDVCALKLLSYDASVSLLDRDVSNGSPEDYKVEKFEEDRQVVFDELHSILQRIRFPLLIGSFIMHLQVTEHQILPILLRIRPKKLRYINLNFSFPLQTYPAPFLDLTTICETEQWKLTRIVEAQNYITDLPLEKWTQCKSSFQWMEPMVTITELQEMLLSSSQIFTAWIILSRPFDQNSFANYIAPLDDGRRYGRRFEYRMRSPTQPYFDITVSVGHNDICMSHYRAR